MTDPQFQARLKGYSLATAEILYRLPDHPELLQLFLWQEYDLAPRFPRLGAFLIYWSDHLEGALYRVRVAHQKLVSPAEFSFIDGELVLH